jgi:hypothetical protein
MPGGDMFPFINIYFYRTRLERTAVNVLTSWSGCVVVPPVGNLVEFGQRPEVSVWKVEDVIWSKPDDRGNQIADVVVSLVTPAP